MSGSVVIDLELADLSFGFGIGSRLEWLELNREVACPVCAEPEVVTDDDLYDAESSLQGGRDWSAWDIRIESTCPKCGTEIELRAGDEWLPV